MAVKKDNESYNSKNKDLLKLYIKCMATCHCLSIINDKIIGDPIDVKMFEKTEWILEDNQNEEDNKNNININCFIFSFFPYGNYKMEKKNRKLIMKIKKYYLVYNQKRKI